MNPSKTLDQKQLLASNCSENKAERKTEREPPRTSLKNNLDEGMQRYPTKVLI